MIQIPFSRANVKQILTFSWCTRLKFLEMKGMFKGHWLTLWLQGQSAGEKVCTERTQLIVPKARDLSSRMSDLTSLYISASTSFPLCLWREIVSLLIWIPQSTAASRKQVRLLNYGQSSDHSTCDYSLLSAPLGIDSRSPHSYQNLPILNPFPRVVCYLHATSAHSPVQDRFL